ncbi:MAG: tRNA lysidine(34) synthetase TilS [Lachnospiraceae bacterium]|nr:tRNA lysidine(34) synthetase TilS [Lachnospiraceae bacterium]
MISRVFEFMEKYKMIEEKDLVVTGVSGGADSLCLFSLLQEYRKKIDFSLVVVHVDHGLRTQAKEEAFYVKEICEREGVPFFLKQIQADQLAKRKKISVEEAGRIARYEAFEEALELYGKKNFFGKKIAVAHHQGDQAETMLFHLFRGTGVNGMAGIMPVRDHIIRPLLTVKREEIEEYLKNKNVSWYEDESNLQECYTRNKIRHRILGYAQKEINEKAVEHVSAAAMQMVELKEYLGEELDRAREDCCKRKEERTEIQLSRMFSYHPFLQGQLLLRLLEELVPGRKDIRQVHIKSILELSAGSGNKELYLPLGIRIRKEYGLLILEKGWEEVKEPLEIRALQEGEYSLGEEEVLEIKLLEREDFYTIEENRCTKYLDYGKISNSLSLRSRQTGDYIIINDRGQKKSLKEYMIEEKIPRTQRDCIPVIADGSHILWIIGYRISAYYKISDKTEKILQMKIKRRE